MTFEVGKCYEHVNGLKIRIITEAYTCAYGRVLIAEDNHGRFMPMGTDEIAALNYTECEDFMPDSTSNEEEIEEVVTLPATDDSKEIDISELNPDAVETKPDDVKDVESEVDTDDTTEDSTDNAAD